VRDELELKILFSRKSRQSRQRFRAILREIREIITLVFSSDAARRRPYPLTPHHSFLITHYSKLCPFVLLSKNLATHCSSLKAHNSLLKIASTIYKTTNLLSDNQKVALSLGRSGRNRYFCNDNSLNKTNA
jgi:hypothetical protein